VLQARTHGGKRQKPYFLNDLPDIYEGVFASMCEVVEKSIKSVASRGKLNPAAVNRPAGSAESVSVDTEYYQLFGYDLMLDEDKGVYLLEVNSYPTIAAGGVLSRTRMRNMYSDMILEMMKVMVAVLLLAAVL
jgi:hypothetical protein